jgi:iron-sulfur cluster repair protein YtfE (RIC family)
MSGLARPDPPSRTFLASKSAVRSRVRRKLMLVGLKRPEDRRSPESVADRLLECHERIRRFSALGVKIARSPEAPADELAAAAEAVHRYFTISLPLHVSDEDESIRPRLLATGAQAPLASALETVTSEHVSIEELIAELADLWSAAATKRAGAAELARDAELAGRLEESLARHLALEEEVVFPALRALDAPSAALVVREMKARRGVQAKE